MAWGKSLVVVTGASRGFGAKLCETLAARLGPGSLILGVARNLQQLQEVGDTVKQANGQVKFVPLVMDLARPDLEALGSCLCESFKAVSGPEGGACQTTMMVHNAGSLGTMHYMAKLTDFQEIKTYFDFNVSSVYPINAAFLEHARKLKETCPDLSIKVVNMSSLSAVLPMRSWSLYCTGKAARDMIFKVLSVEEKDVTVLNYAPGPLDTDMQAVAREGSEDSELRESFITLKRDHALLSAQQSVDKLLQTLETGTFATGDHVDYYDV